MTVDRIELSPGYTISRVIKGGWQLAGGHGPIDERQALADMARFVDAGITTFDCADIYTGVEVLIGRFLRARGSSATPVQVHTKLVPDRSRLTTFSRADAAAAIDRSLTRLGVERLDLVQFHWWDYGVPRYLDVVADLARLQQHGKIRLIGLTNFDTERLAAIAGVTSIASHQVQYSVLDGRPAASMAAACRERDIALLCYGSVAGGFISERWLDAAEPPFPHDNRSLTKYHLIIDEFGGWPLFQELLRALAHIARRHGVSIGSVAIRWVLDRPQAAAAIVGATSTRHLDSTLQALTLRLDDADRGAIADVLSRAHGPGGDVYALEREEGGKHARIMRYELNAS
jgi:aryl-alcohol dehydrogenase-like predicted oxidoreductase